MDEVSLRNMSAEELSVAVEWAAREGWNPGLDDAAAFFAADPEGFFRAEADGETVGTISAVAYGEGFGFIGFYIVKPDRRGHRDGLLLAERAMARLEGRNIGIDGVLAKQRQYAKFFGFQFAYRNLRFGGTITSAPVPKTVIPLGEMPFDTVAAYDRRHFPAERNAFLRTWLTMPHATGFACERDGQMVGYGVIRQCREGFKIGPLFADDEVIARDLFVALTSRTGGQPVFLDVPEPNTTAVRLAEHRGMKEVFATARMYNREVPDLPIDEIFGVTTFELG
jgi:Acetyltransferase (GNAT) domain/Acetyltransferase (GNAT) family